MENPFPRPDAEDLSRSAAMLGLLADIGDIKIATTLIDVFNLADLNADDRHYLEGPVIFAKDGGWHEHTPQWVYQQARAERIDLILGQKPGWIVTPCEIIAVLMPLSGMGPMGPYLPDLYFWATTHAMSRKEHTTREAIADKLGWKLIPDEAVLKPDGRLYNTYRRLADDIRGKVMRGSREGHRVANRASRILLPLKRTPKPALGELVPKTVEVPPEVAAALCTAEVDGVTIRITQQLERPLYEAVDKVLRAMGGKWSKKHRAHLFPSDPLPLLTEALGTGEALNRRKTLQLFETPPELAELAASHLPHNPGLVLEPNAGTGRLVDAALKRGAEKVRAVEIDQHMAMELAERYRAHPVDVVPGNFLSMTPTGTPFNGAILNPPFAAHQDIHHVLHAWNWLGDDGRLVAVMSPTAFASGDRIAQEFRSWVAETGADVIDIPAGTFAEAGTPLATKLVIATRR
jgi:predicted RNA methylase